MTSGDLPDLRGWATAAVLGRRLGVSAGTVRRRASRGLLDAYPNPLGPGALYRAHDPKRLSRSGEHENSRETREELRHGQIRSLGSTDRYVLGVLPATTPQVAASAGIAPASAARCLARLERAGYARRSGRAAPGPRGGRPAVVWEASKP